MHAVFMIYGKKEMVDFLIRDMTAQKLPMKFWKGEEKVDIYIDCQLRILPFGMYEFVFPKEHKDTVLTTLNFHQENLSYNLDKSIMGFKPINLLREFLRIKEVDPKTINHEKKLLWWSDHIGIIPIGIREDKEEIVETDGMYKGWSHEAI